ncbi:MAG: ACP S-malonyltransferase [Alphaproteobacteria bacterium]|nr:ACP S-malonyltransferase [Alphaproteobacteria bacterium]
MVAFVFPGQGSQAVGMGQDLYAAFPAARAVFDAVDDALGQKLSALMFAGDIQELTRTQNVQPAIMAVGIAVVRALESETGKGIAELCHVAAGHSLGEYTALCAAGAMDVAAAARLLRARGLAMAQAAEQNPGGMAVVLGLSLDQAREAARAASAVGEICVVANDNAPGQVVLSGHPSAIARAAELCRSLGAKRALALNVSGAFHSELMQPAADAFCPALTQAKLHAPRVPVVSNVTAAEETDVGKIKGLLATQMTSPVRWTESVQFMMRRGVKKYVECGHGSVMKSMISRIDPSADIVCLSDAQSVAAYLAK